MKKLILLAGLLFSTMVFSQAPEQMSYQTVIRNTSGQLIQNQNVAVKVSILKDSPSGTVVYSERLTGTTNANGLLSTAIGSGTVISGTFSTINWASGNYYLKTETDPDGGTSYTISGTSQLLSVPYAMYAKTAGSGSGFSLPYSGTLNNSSPLFSLTNTGSGKGVLSNTGSGFAVHGITTEMTSAGIVGDNNGGGEAIVGRNTSDIAGAVVGRNNGGGYGVKGFIAGNTSGTAIGVLGQIGNSGSTGRAGRFENINATNLSNTFEVETNGNGNIPDNKQGNASSFLVNNTNSVAAAVRGEVKTIFGNFGAAGIFGVSSGTGGYGGLFHSSNPEGNGAALVAVTDGNGNAITANAGKNGNAIESTVDGTGSAVYGWVPSFSTGKAARFQNFNADNTNDVMTVKTVGKGIAGNFMVDNTQAISAAVKGEVNSIFANFGTAGVYGLSSGTGGYGGLFYQSNESGNGPALLAITKGNGNGITTNAGKNGNGIESTVDGTGSAVYGWVPNYSTGKAARFQNFNSSNFINVFEVESNSTANLAVFKKSGSNVARINSAGKGFFNGGTQNSGADIAEAFDVEGNPEHYEPGDILVISTKTDRSVEKSSKSYSTLVAGVYATKPGVLLTEENIDSDLEGKVPMGVIGVIPTKVCIEGGTIKRGDLLVTSSISGVAMKADLDKVKVGQVLGKALQDFNENGIGKINVLVSIK